MKDVPPAQAIRVRVSDMCSLARKRCTPVFSPFLNEQEQYEAQSLIKGESDIFASFYGGNEYCVRKMLCVSVYEEDVLDTDKFPVYCVCLSYRRADMPAHKDILGAVMGTGIGREQVGDIFIGEDAAAVYCTKTAKDAVCAGLDTVGRIGVKISEGLSESARKALHPPQFQELDITAASLRCDCIVSALTGMSRALAQEYIHSGRFMLNYAECTDKSRTVAVGDVLTLRGHGKFTIGDPVTETKKGRLRLTVKKYK